MTAAPWTPSAELLALQKEHAEIKAAMIELQETRTRDFNRGHERTGIWSQAGKYNDMRTRRFAIRERILELFKREALGDGVWP